MQNLKLRVASRTSPLAIFQTHEVIDRLKEFHSEWDFCVVPISTKGDRDQSYSRLPKILKGGALVPITKGDRDQSSSLQNLGQTGIFTKALDDAILEGKADIGVHSLKDYPTNVPRGLKLLAVLPRDGYLDAFIPGNNGKL